MDPQLPIDIHLTKLLDWILDRRHCQRDWTKSAVPIREKINLAIQDMPEHPEITNLLTGTSIHYFNCLKIVEILKETEKQSKNIFGMYSSQRMKDWQAIVSAFQKQNIYLAEAASILQRNVAYEIPGLKKQLNKSQQQQTECEEKCISLDKTVNEVNQQIRKMCAGLGIEGLAISRELKQLPNELDNVSEEICNRASEIRSALTFYSNYVEHFLTRAPNSSLTTLTFLVDKGNKRVYEWRTGSEPSKVEEREQLINFNFGEMEEEKKKEEEIDFGEIDFGADDTKVDKTSAGDDQEGGDIDWGDIGEEEEEKETSQQVDEIDYDLDAIRSEICVESSGVYVPSDGIAKGDDALTLIGCTKTRNLLFNDLHRLEMFLQQKQVEMTCDSDNLLISTIMQDAPKSIQAVTEKDVASYLACVRSLLSYLGDKRVEQLFRILDVPNYLKRLYEQFEQKRRSIARCRTLQEQRRQRVDELRAEDEKVRANLQLIIKKTKELQKFACDDLSKKYNGVRINLMGEINLI